MDQMATALRQPIGGALVHRENARRAHVGAAEYAGLRTEIQSAGLLDRAYGYYWARGLLTYTMFATAVLLMILLPPTWGWTVVAGACFGFAAMQVSMLGHD